MAMAPGHRPRGEAMSKTRIVGLLLAGSLTAALIPAFIPVASAQAITPTCQIDGVICSCSDDDAGGPRYCEDTVTGLHCSSSVGPTQDIQVGFSCL